MNSNREILHAVTDGPLHEVPEGAVPAPGCRCETPWLERDADEQLHCVNCGLDYRP